MIKCRFLALGATGAKVADSLVLSAFAGALYSAGAGISDLDILVIDPDRREPRVQQLIRHVQEYNTLFQSENAESKRLKTRIGIDRLPFAENSGDELLQSLLFTGSLRSTDAASGTQNRTELGIFVLSAMLSGNEFEQWLQKTEGELAGGDDVRCIVCGSLCGGTGTVGVKVLPGLLSERLGRYEGFSQHLLLMMPYYAHPDMEIILQRAGSMKPAGIVTSTTILGLPEGTRCSASSRASAMLPEWLGAMVCVRLCRSEVPLKGCFTWHADSDRADWAIFGSDGKMCAQRFGGMLKAASALLISIAEPLAQRLTSPSLLRDRMGGWYRVFFGNSRHFEDAERNQQINLLETLVSLCRDYLSWYRQIVTSLPFTMAHADALAEARDNAAAHYEKVLLCAGQLKAFRSQVERTGIIQSVTITRYEREETPAEAAARQLKELEDKLSDLACEQLQLNRVQGGAASIAMFRHFEQLCREEALAAHEDVNEGSRRIDRAAEIAQPHEIYKIATARTKLLRLEQYAESLDGRLERVISDLEEAGRNGTRFLPPELEDHSPSACGLASLSALDDVMEATVYDRGKKNSRKAAAENAWPELLPGSPDQPSLKAVLDQLGRLPEGSGPDSCSPVLNLFFALMEVCLA